MRSFTFFYGMRVNRFANCLLAVELLLMWRPCTTFSWANALGDTDLDDSMQAMLLS